MPRSRPSRRRCGLRPSGRRRSRGSCTGPSPLTILRRPTKADVAAVAATWGIVAAKSVDLLDRLSGRDGLRGVDRVIRKAWVFAGARAPSLEYLTASAEFFYPLQGAK
ncbi:MAG: hypothetical protein IPL38_00235 [Rhodobacter sp.]|nr:hypothetical protein [Rhodobacter sp.]